MKHDAFSRWPRLDEIFDRALDLDGTARDQFLDEWCADDAELRAELERLLAADANAEGPLDQLSPGLADPEIPVTEEGSGLSGRQVGHYEIYELLGMGGMGAVYRAHDTTLGRSVALKFLRPHLGTNPDARGRFIHEARAASAFDHPNICTVYEIGETDDGQVFIAMAYCDGETLRSRLARGPMPLEECLGVGQAVGAGLERAHEAGIVHRDLKPANIMLTDHGEVKILDFGIAKLEGGTELTRPGSRLGTVAYMSPEQASGEPVDHQSDIWAFGVVLYEMLTGVRPFQRDNEQAAVYGILNERPAPVGELREETPEGLQAVVTRCLTRDRNQRYAHLADVLADLQAVRDGEAVTPDTAAVAAPSRWNGRRVGLAMVGGVAVGGLALAGAFFLPTQSVPFEERDWLLITAIENLTGDSLLDRTLDSWLASGIGESKRVNVLPENRIRRVLQRMQRSNVDVIDEELALEIAQRVGVSVVLVPSLSSLDGTYRFSARLVNPANGLDFDVVNETVDGRGEVTAALNRVIVRIRRRLGETRFAMFGTTTPLPGATTASLAALKAYASGTRSWRAGRWQEARQAWHDAVGFDSTFARAHSNLGMSYYQINDRTRGEEHFERALANIDRVSRNERLWIRGQIESNRGNLEGSLRILETLVREYPDYQDAWFNLGTGYMGRRDCDRAEAALDQVLRIDPNVGQAHIQVATCYNGTGKLDLAVDRYERAFEIDPALLTWRGVNHEYGNALVKRGELDRAEAVFTTMAETTPPGTRAEGLRSLALLEMRRGRFARAISTLEQSTSVFRREGAALSVLRNRLYLAVAFRATGQSGRFEEQLHVAGAIADSISITPIWLAYIGRLHARAGNPQAAARFLDAIEPVFSEPNAEDHAMRDLLRGEIEMALGNYAAAVTAFERANANRDDALLSESLARAYALNGDVDQAIDEFLEVISQHAAGWEAQHPWILAHDELGRLYEANEEYERAVEYYSRFVDIWADADARTIPSTGEARRRIDLLRRQLGIG